MTTRSSRDWRVWARHCRNSEVVELGVKSLSMSNQTPIRKVSCRYIIYGQQSIAFHGRSILLCLRIDWLMVFVASFSSASRISTVHNTGLSETTIAFSSSISLLVLTNPPNSVTKSSNPSESLTKGIPKFHLNPCNVIDSDGLEDFVTEFGGLVS